MPIQDMADLRQRMMSTSAGFKQSVVDEAVDQWQKDSMPMFMHFEQLSLSHAS